MSKLKCEAVMRITLLYFKGCPNVESTRKNLREALDNCALTEQRWEEVDVRDSRIPHELSGFPSPTVLINGLDVDTGRRRASGGGACRLGGAPSVEILRESLQR